MSRLRPGGKLIVLSCDPTSSAPDVVVERDLGGTAPFHPETWVHVLESQLDDVAVLRVDDAYVVVGVRS